MRATISSSGSPVLTVTSSWPPCSNSSTPRWEMGSATRTLNFCMGGEHRMRARMVSKKPLLAEARSSRRLPAMNWSFRIARVAGIEVKIHFTFLLLLGWFGLEYYRFGGIPAAVAGISFILLLFLCVLLHEFGHAMAARYYGI